MNTSDRDRLLYSKLKEAKANLYKLMTKENVKVFPPDAGPADRVTIRYSDPLRHALDELAAVEKLITKEREKKEREKKENLEQRNRINKALADAINFPLGKPTLTQRLNKTITKFNNRAKENKNLMRRYSSS
jgi:outer membrane protein OmpA-like peptidoglycan-associated protein